jgi:hypothetical protein
MDRYIIGKHWPTRYDYELALEDLPTNMLDPELRQGNLERHKQTSMLIYRGRPDSHTCLYRIDDKMIRCFCHAQEERIAYDDILARYKALDLFYRENHTRISALIPIQYVEHGMNIDCYKRDLFLDEMVEFIETRKMPFVKMDFIHGRALNDFIALSYQDKEKMRALKDAWVKMIREMDALRMAHGDLDLTNVLVIENPEYKQIGLKLIDYDNTWIPAFTGFHYPLPEQGHEFFQHPSFFGKSRTFNETIDRFAALVIYISLQVLIDYPHLYISWQMNDNRLLFSPGDYQAEQRRESGKITQLRAMHVNGLEPYLDELSSCLRENRMPVSVIAIINNAQGPADPLENEEKPRTFDSAHIINIPDWDNIEYFTPTPNEAGPQPQIPAPRQLPEDEFPQRDPLPSVQEESLPRYRSLNERRQRDQPQPPQESPFLRPPRVNQQPIQPVLPPSPEALIQQSIERQKTNPLPPPRPAQQVLLEPQRIQPVFQQEQIVLPSNTATYDPFAETRNQEQPPLAWSQEQSPSIGSQEQPPSARARQQPAKFDLTTLVGCGVILLLLLAVAVVIFLIISLTHVFHVGITQPAYQAFASGGLYVRD